MRRPPILYSELIDDDAVMLLGSGGSGFMLGSAFMFGSVFITFGPESKSTWR